MAIKAGQILFLGNDQFLLDRVQSAGVPNINVPRDRIFELGNYLTLGNVRDIPDLGFTIDSYQISTELPSLLTGVAPSSITTGSYVDYANLKPMDIVSPFKAASTLSTSNTSTSVRGVAIPFLFLESVSYRFGVSALSSVSYSLRGDSVYYVPGTPYVYTFPAQTWTVGTTYNWQLPSAAGGGAATAIGFPEDGTTLYAMNVVEIDASNNHTRKTQGVDYTDSAAGIAFTSVGLPASTSKVRVVFGSLASSTYTETGASSPNSATVAGSDIHDAVSTTGGYNAEPAAVRGRYVEVFVGLDTQATPKPLKFSRVQSANVNWRVNLERDEEFNNRRIVYMDYNDAPEVSGQLMVKSVNATELFNKIAQTQGVVNTNVTGPLNVNPIPVEIKLLGTDGQTITDIYIPNATFDINGYDQRVQQKNMTNFNFFSEDGVMQVYAGDRPGS